MLRQKSASEKSSRARRPSMWIGHGKRMGKALEISMITLRCHEETWGEIHRLMRRVDIWNAPQAVPCPSKPHVEVQLPGRKAAAALHEMRANAFLGNGFDRAFARRVYVALAMVVDQFDPSNSRKPLPSAVLDGTADHDAD